MSYCSLVIAGAIRTVIDQKKTQEFMTEMVILGLQVTFVWEKKAIAIRLRNEKAVQWLRIVLGTLACGMLSQGEAVKVAGMLNWTTCALLSRIGRAQIKLLYAQANPPLLV